MTATGSIPVILSQQGHNAVVLVLQRAPVHLRWVRREHDLRLLQTTCRSALT